MEERERVLLINPILKELADAAWRQKQLRFYAHIVDAISLLGQAYLQKPPTLPLGEAGPLDMSESAQEGDRKI